jgi:pimeloyl-ACP methyl ester carboxylesterase
VRASNGTLPASEAQRIVERLPGSRLAEIAGAGHDVHLDQTTGWQHAVEEFLTALE